MIAVWLIIALGGAVEVSPGYCDPQDPKRCAAPIQRGQPAPFDGQVLTVEQAIQLGLKADGCDARITQEVNLVRRLGELDLELERKLRKVDQEAADETERSLKRMLAESDPPFYERPWFVATVTATLTVAAMGLAVWGAGQLN